MKSLGNRSDMVGLISKNKYRKERYNSKNLAELTKTKDKYIVLCLHYEPEANCCPYGGIYGDQLAFALKLNSICKKQNILEACAWIRTMTFFEIGIIEQFNHPTFLTFAMGRSEIALC
mgnify:CR=1 FL=1